MRRRSEIGSQRAGHEIHQVVSIIDCVGIGLSGRKMLKVRKTSRKQVVENTIRRLEFDYLFRVCFCFVVTQFFKVTSVIDQDFYPETLHSMYFVNCPSIFPIIWNICKGFIDVKTQQKIKILGHDLSPMIADLGEDCLPVEFGGKCQCKGGCIPPKMAAE